jgi:hypothetical protein
MDTLRKWAIRGGTCTLIAAAVAAGGYGIAEAAAGPSAAGGHPTATLAKVNPAPGRSSAHARRRQLRRVLRRDGYVVGVGTLEGLGHDSVTVATRRFGTRTVGTTSQTTYVEAMTLVPRSDLKAGEKVGLLVKLGTSTTDPAKGATVVSLEIVIPRLSGMVTSISGNKIGLHTAKGANYTLITSPSTSYREFGDNVAAGRVSVGTRVVGFGTPITSTTLAARTVAVVGPLGAGRVTAVHGSIVTVKGPLRGTYELSVDPSAVLRSNNGPATLKSIKVGDLVLAIGKPGASASGKTFDASAVAFGTKPSGRDLLWLAYVLGWPRLGGPHSHAGVQVTTTAAI